MELNQYVLYRSKTFVLDTSSCGYAGKNFPKTNGQGGFFPCAVQSSSGCKILNIYVCALESNTLGDVLQLVQLF